MATLINDNMPRWAPVTKHYRTADGQDLAVEVGEPVGVGGGFVEKPRPTVIFACTEEGYAVDLTPLHRFPPGTTHEDALTQAGYL